MMLRILLLILAFAWAACSKPAPPPEPPMPVLRPKPKAEEEKADEEESEDEYVFSPVGKRDPFRAHIEELLPEAELEPDPLCGPLCNWHLEQLRLAAVVSGMASPLAMVVDPQGNGHNVRRGTSIGKRNGKVTEILRDRIIVTEYRRLSSGEVVPFETELVLRAMSRYRDDEPENLLMAQDDELATQDGETDE